jgi:hypothetical protein
VPPYSKPPEDPLWWNTEKNTKILHWITYRHISTTTTMDWAGQCVDLMIAHTTTTGNLEVGNAEAGVTTLMVKPMKLRSKRGQVQSRKKGLTILTCRAYIRKYYIYEVIRYHIWEAFNFRELDCLLRTCRPIRGSTEWLIVPGDRLRKSESQVTDTVNNIRTSVPCIFTIGKHSSRRLRKRNA